MNKITAFIAALKLRLLDRFTPTLSGLLASLNKLEVQIETAIDKGERDLEGLAASAAALVRACEAKNIELNSAYKLLHNVSGLVR